ncbi:MAG TPA: helix-turn-helix domain-containing protein, partial [Microbacteriaceae bacterium]
MSADDLTDVTELKRGRPGYDQRAVLEIAVAAFNEFGYDATSMGVLAKRLGLSKSAIYHHFAAKEDILELALDEALTALEAVLVENVTIDADAAADSAAAA